VTVLIFFLLIGFVFWLASLHERADHRAHVPSPASVPHPGGDLALGGAVRQHSNAAAEMRGLSAEDVHGRTKRP
jgi:hypothetical protein